MPRIPLLELPFERSVLASEELVVHGIGFASPLGVGGSVQSWAGGKDYKKSGSKSEKAALVEVSECLQQELLAH
jgi:hypothetical protein